MLARRAKATPAHAGGAEGPNDKCFYEPDVREGADGVAAQRQIAWLFSPVRYHNKFPRSTCLAELLRSCVLVPWEARLLGGHYCAAESSGGIELISKPSG